MPLDEVSSTIVWRFLGWKSGTMFSTTCQEANGLPRAVGKAELLEVLKNTQVGKTVSCWQALEMKLQNVVSIPSRSYVADRMPNKVRVFHYAQELAAQQVLPPMKPELIAAVQVGLQEAWLEEEPRMTKQWVELMMSHLQHNAFVDFATKFLREVQPQHRQRPTLFDVYREVTQTALSVEDGVDDVGYCEQFQFKRTRRGNHRNS